MERTTQSAARIGDRTGQSLFSSILRTLLFSLFTLLAFLLFLAFLLNRYPDPEKFLVPASLAATGSASLLGGLRVGKLHRSAGTLAGLLHGMFFVFLCLLAATVTGGGMVAATAVPFYLGVLLLSVLGGYLSARRPRRRTKHKR